MELNLLKVKLTEERVKQIRVVTKPKGFINKIGTDTPGTIHSRISEPVGGVGEAEMF